MKKILRTLYALVVSTTLSSYPIPYSIAGRKNASKEIIITKDIDEWNEGRASKIATNNNEQFIIVWNTENNDITFQRFSTSGVPVDNEPVKASITAGSNSEPVVAMNNDGTFVIAWKSNNTILARRFNSSGVALDTVPINIEGTLEEPASEPTIAMDNDGDFTVAWKNSSKVFARRFDALGKPLDTNPIQINETGSAQEPDIDMNSKGEFIIAWCTPADSDSVGEIYVRRFDAGTPKDLSPIKVSDNDVSNSDPEVATDNNGNFIVAWERPEKVTQKGSYDYSYTIDVDKVYAKRFDNSGTVLGDEFRVSKKGKKIKGYDPTVVMDNKGDFVIVWSEYKIKNKKNCNGGYGGYSVNRSGYSYSGCYRITSDVYMRRFRTKNPEKLKKGKLTRVSSIKNYYEEYPQLAINSNNKLIIAWERKEALGGMKHPVVEPVILTKIYKNK